MKKLLTGIFLIPFMILQLCMVSYAAEEEQVHLQDTSILQMVILYTDTDGIEHIIQGGSGFLIGTEQSGAEYMITAREVTSVSEEIKQRVVELYSGESTEEKITYKTKAVVSEDVMVDLTLVAESDEMGFSVWSLSEPLYDREIMVLCDKALTGTSGINISAIGFSTAPNLTDDTVYYSKDQLVTMDGMQIGDGKEGNVKYLYHNIVPNLGMLGGPIVNEEGHVVALNQLKEVQEGYYALQISELLPILEALGITYVTTGDLEAQRQAELATTVYKEKLQKGIQVAQSLDSSDYYKDSFVVLQECLAKAQAVNDSNEVTQQEIDYALAKLNVAMSALEERPPFWVIFFIALFVMMIIIIVFVIAIIKAKAKSEQKKFEKAINRSTIKIENIEQKQPKQEEVYGETTVICQNTDATVVLRQEEKKQEAYLIRKRSDERIIITGEEFVLGKDPSQTNYWLTGNSAISRIHAVILHKGTDYMISDKNATNGTFVNGEKVAALQEIILKDNDIVKLADEDFEFHLEEE